VHQQTFGFAYEGQQDVELVNLRVQAVGKVHRPLAQKLGRASGAPMQDGTRPVYWRGQGWRDCPIYKRERLPLDARLEGPAIVEEYGSTVVVPDGWFLTVDAYGNLLLRKTP